MANLVAHKRKIYSKNWYTVTLRKCKRDLVFKEIETQNIALLMKMAWQMKESENVFGYICSKDYTFPPQISYTPLKGSSIMGVGKLVRTKG